MTRMMLIWHSWRCKPVARCTNYVWCLRCCQVTICVVTRLRDSDDVYLASLAVRAREASSRDLLAAATLGLSRSSMASVTHRRHTLSLHSHHGKVQQMVCHMAGIVSFCRTFATTSHTILRPSPLLALRPSTPKGGEAGRTCSTTSVSRLVHHSGSYQRGKGKRDSCRLSCGNSFIGGKRDSCRMSCGGTPFMRQSSSNLLGAAHAMFP